MDAKREKKISKFLSLILRHKPETIGLELDSEGWALLSDILEKTDYKLHEIEQVVENNDKKRFTLEFPHPNWGPMRCLTGARIRANQGHSIDVDLKLEAQTPPDVLYHGTVGKFLGLIMKDGLKKMSRQHVHLSADLETASKVGTRRGSPIILEVDAKQMHEDGLEFFISDNGVWLSDSVPAKYLTVRGDA